MSLKAAAGGESLITKVLKVLLGFLSAEEQDWE